MHRDVMSDMTGIALLLGTAALCLVVSYAHATPPLEEYGRLPGVELARISPSGERLALIAVAGDQRRLLVMTTAGALLKAAVVGDTKVRDIGWASDQHLFVTTTATVNLPLVFAQRNELASVIHIGMGDKKNDWAVFDRSRSIAHIVTGYYGTAEKSGHWFGYFGGITETHTMGDDYVLNHGYSDLYRVNLETGDSVLEAHGSDLDPEWLMSNDGKLVAHADYEQSKGEWRLFAGQQSGDALIKKLSPTDDIGLVGLGRTNGTILVLDRSGDADVLEEISLTGGKREVLFDTQSTTGYLFDPINGLLIGAQILEEPRTVLFNPKLQARMNAARKAFPGLQVHLVAYSHDFARLLVETDGDDDSGTLWLVDIATGKANPLGYEYPAVKSADVAATRIVNYQASDGLSMEGILTLPRGRDPKNLPLIVMPHGGPIGIADHLGFNWWAQGMASRGYAVFQPNYRGSSGYGSHFRTAGFGQWGRKMLTDISDGILELAKQQIIDPKRVCIVGGSYGGYAALAGVTLQQGIYKCAVSVSGPANLLSFGAWQGTRYGNLSDATRYWKKLTGVEPDGETVLRTISPVFHADKADAPILLIHGKDDTRVPIEQSEEMAASLKRANKVFDFVTLPREDHFLSREVTRTSMLKAAVSFVEKYNPPQ